jgi:hypothetical protein
MEGMLIAIESFEHVSDQIVRHARLVARKLGYVDAHLEFYSGGAVNMHDIVENAKQALGQVDRYVLGGLWLEHKFVPNSALLKGWLEQDRLVFVRNYIPRLAAQLAFEEGLVDEEAIRYAEWFCRHAYRRHGLPEVDVGIIIADSRLDTQIIQYGNQKDGYEYRPRKISSKVEVERNLLIASTKDDRRWHCIQAGIPELPVNVDGIPCRKENESFRRAYSEVESEVIRLVVPGAEKLSNEELIGLLDAVQFQEA